MVGRTLTAAAVDHGGHGARRARRSRDVAGRTLGTATGGHRVAEATARGGAGIGCAGLAVGLLTIGGRS